MPFLGALARKMGTRTSIFIGNHIVTESYLNLCIFSYDVIWKIINYREALARREIETPLLSSPLPAAAAGSFQVQLPPP